MNWLSLDKNLFLFINGFAGNTPLLDFLVQLVVNEYFVPVTLTLVIVYIWFGRGKLNKGSRQVLPIAALSVGLVNLLIAFSNQFIIRTRPFDELVTNMLFYKPTDPSFPSNAAAVGFALAVSILLVNRKLGVYSLALAAFYGVSRVYVGVHFPSDVIVGVLIGIISVLFVSNFKRSIRLLTSKIEDFQSRLNLEF
ncbi:MAG: hypothetical protein A2Z11_01270 [Candidatus Woykebacteria bacterium RBG_16_43_9]|uniref:Phosphatidic acid phosphatase type 2/haloperoxidase domain-containing protein n=1 Tax=Candidatus Woykebacteria bacterium RBG_16_43_9 TaxID=1802596 RepID=A0A1G1WBQ8_9BACT|nr:MAG: hypothetical protein A2Z11_01270 [Candidatus Woykebacteria bacterium RBG_16_43_9]